MLTFLGAPRWHGELWWKECAQELFSGPALKNSLRAAPLPQGSEVVALSLALLSFYIGNMSGVALSLSFTLPG